MSAPGTLPPEPAGMKATEWETSMAQDQRLGGLTTPSLALTEPFLQVRDAKERLLTVLLQPAKQADK